MALIDFALSNARRFYSSMGNPLGLKGLILIECKEEATIAKQTPLRKHLFSLELSSSVAVIAA